MSSPLPDDCQKLSYRFTDEVQYRRYLTYRKTSLSRRLLWAAGVIVLTTLTFGLGYYLGTSAKQNSYVATPPQSDVLR
ncbi:hypothetical protein [Leptolyngbya sp. FACHB-261]|uniref:hypothetical protein n=1 Tax=Leptolyngbya sp. FACHB-261 TaxID=2692806 RepID=UPI001685744A|nr:hypothetical protein [Leptolyngbya sp. FACHB-261]MBD2103905.1 hypothetical protein [Leptolyngbya sp. FACHB-261]